MLPLFSTNELPDAPGCRLPFGLGFLAFVALIVLGLMVGFAALSLLIGLMSPVPNQQPGINGPGGGVPPISARYFGSGSTHASVTGALSFPGDLQIDPVASYVEHEGLAWIYFGGAVSGGPEVLITFHEPENAVTVANGLLHATAQDEACSFDVNVTQAVVSGHISCPSVPVFNGDEAAGSAAIELDFTANTDASIDPGAEETMDPADQ